MLSLSRRELVRASLAGLASLFAAGCGTILHPERRGQPAGRLDWGVVVLDGIGLLLFFIPGVIAFAVDFSNGTIYLPPDHYGSHRPDHDESRLVSVPYDGPAITPTGLETVLSRHTRREIRLTPGNYQTAELASLDEFWECRARLAG